MIHIDGTRNLILLFSTSHAQHDGCRVVERDSPGLRRGIACELRRLVAESAEIFPGIPTSGAGDHCTCPSRGNQNAQSELGVTTWTPRELMLQLEAEYVVLPGKRVGPTAAVADLRHTLS